MKIDNGPHTMTVEYKKGNDDYKVVMTTRSIKAIYNMNAKGAFDNLSGEKKIAAIIAKSRGKGMARVERFKNGELHDGPKGEPARLYFNQDGDIVTMDSINNGVLKEANKGQKKEYSAQLDAIAKIKKDVEVIYVPVKELEEIQQAFTKKMNIQPL